MLDVMKILKEASGGAHPPEFLATHPLPETRLEQIQAELKEAYPDGHPIQPDQGPALADRIASGESHPARRTATLNRSRCSLLGSSTFQVALRLQALEVSQHLVERFDRLARDAPGVVELAEQLQVLEELRTLELAAESRAEPPFSRSRAGPCDARSARASAR